MADNVPVTPGTGAVIATDDVAGVQYQRVKLDLGGDGLSSPVVDSLPVAIQGTVPLDISTVIEISNDIGNPIPVTGTMEITNDIGNAIPVSGTVSVGNFPATQAVTGTFWQATQPVSAASLPLPTGAATETTLAALNTKIPASPATEGGNLATLVARTPALGQAAMAASSPVVIASNQSAVPVNQAGVSATGSLGALNATVELALNGATGFSIDLRGTFSATVAFQGTVDGTNWVNLTVIPAGSGTNVAAVVNATAAGAWVGNANGLQRVRANCTAYTSGTVTVVLRAMQAAGVVYNLPVGATTQTVSGTVTANIGTGTLSAVTSANLGIPSVIADVASAALTSTTTTAAFTPTFGTTYTINVPVTAVSGTTPTLDIGVEESDDSGTNWYRVYDFPRITVTGGYRSPPLTLRGNRVRYVQTVTGTTPSFTRAINRLQRSDDAPLRVSFVDRTIVPNTLNSTTPAYYVEGCSDFNFAVRCSAQTTAATITAQFSHDGTNWFSTAATITTAVGVVQAKIQNEQWKFARLNVTANGTGITLGEVNIVGRSG